MMTTMNLKLPDPRRFFKWMLLICALSVLLLAIVCAIPTPLQARAEGFSETAAQEETEEPVQQPTEETTVQPTQAPTAEPTRQPTEAPTVEPTEQPTQAPTVEPTQQPTQAPTAEPTQQPTQAPEPPAGAYTIAIKAPSGWKRDKADVTISIADDNGTGWAHLRILMAAGSKWTTLVDGGESTDTYHVEIRENCSIYVSVTDLAGNVHAKSTNIICFDTEVPRVSAGISGDMLCIEATDSISGIKAVYINNHRLTRLSGGTLDARIRDYADGLEYISIYAVDNADNRSEIVKVKNPYYGQDEPEEEATPKPTKKPSSGGAKASAKPTATPVPTDVPQATATPVPTNVMLPDLIPDGTGTAYSPSGNMKTLDLLYSKATHKQFITIETRKGEVYYLVIDYDKPIDEDGERYETYFLNAVDDRDLLAVLDEVDKPTPEPTASPTPKPTATPKPEASEGEKPSSAPVLALMLLMALGGGVVVYFVMQKKAAKPKPHPDLDDEDEDDEDDQ